MHTYFTAACWALAMLAVAMLSRTGSIDRDAAGFLLLCMPMIAFATLLGGRRCAPDARAS